MPIQSHSPVGSKTLLYFFLQLATGMPATQGAASTPGVLGLDSACRYSPGCVLPCGGPITVRHGHGTPVCLAGDAGVRIPRDSPWEIQVNC